MLCKMCLLVFVIAGVFSLPKFAICNTFSERQNGISLAKLVYERY